MVSSDIEQVVLMDADGAEIGTAPKSSVHGADTLLHLAFSCHVFDQAGQLLVTRRALAKTAWPGVWTNSFCGHPAPAEELTSAVRRRAEYELGIGLERVEPVLPFFRYRAVDATGVVENEICPVYVATTVQEPRLHPEEAIEHHWVNPDDLAESIRRSPWVFSPWLVLQAQLLPFLGGTGELTERAS